MNITKSKKSDIIIEAAAETYQKGWEVAFSLMESYFSDRWRKKIRSTS